MYAQMVFRNKRFKPSFPVRESDSMQDQMLVDQVVEVKTVPEQELKVDEPELDVLAV